MAVPGTATDYSVPWTEKSDAQEKETKLKAKFPSPASRWTHSTCPRQWWTCRTEWGEPAIHVWDNGEPVGQNEVNPQSMSKTMVNLLDRWGEPTVHAQDNGEPVGQNEVNPQSMSKTMVNLLDRMRWTHSPCPRQWWTCWTEWGEPTVHVQDTTKLIWGLRHRWNYQMEWGEPAILVQGTGKPVCWNEVNMLSMSEILVNVSVGMRWNCHTCPRHDWTHLRGEWGKEEKVLQPTSSGVVTSAGIQAVHCAHTVWHNQRLRLLTWYYLTHRKEQNWNRTLKHTRICMHMHQTPSTILWDPSFNHCRI